MPVNYQLGKIYQIIDYTNENVYIGSTCEPTLARRLAGHVSNYKAYLNGDKKYVSSYKIIENNNYDIQLIEAFPCDTRDELHKREGYYIKNTPNCVNKMIAGRTKKDSNKQYYEDNKEIICEKKKQYRQDNNQKINERKRQHYNDNKDKINEQRKQPMICICGSEIQKVEKARHEKSQKHKSFIENQQVTVN